MPKFVKIVVKTLILLTKLRTPESDILIFRDFNLLNHWLGLKLVGDILGAIESLAIVKSPISFTLVFQ